MSDTAGVVYFVRYGDMVKVGYTTMSPYKQAVKSRSKSFSEYHGLAGWKILFALYVTDGASLLESHFHNLFSEKRILSQGSGKKLELFDLDDGDLSMAREVSTFRGYPVVVLSGDRWDCGRAHTQIGGACSADWQGREYRQFVEMLEKQRAAPGRPRVVADRRVASPPDPVPPVPPVPEPNRDYSDEVARMIRWHTARRWIMVLLIALFVALLVATTMKDRKETCSLGTPTYPSGKA